MTMHIWPCTRRLLSRRQPAVIYYFRLGARASRSQRLATCRWFRRAPPDNADDDDGDDASDGSQSAQMIRHHHGNARAGRKCADELALVRRTYAANSHISCIGDNFIARR